MKITCSIEVLSRCYFASNPKFSKDIATLALCYCSKRKKNLSDRDACLILCTHDNIRKAKYKVFNNVDKLFTNNVNEGKATLRFKEPAHDLIMTNADPLQLKGFIHGVGLTIVGKGSGKIRFSPIPSKVDRPKRKVSFSKKKSFSKSSVPPETTWLQVQHCSLKSIDQRIINLRNLQVLDLAHNSLGALPMSIANIRLKEFILHHNRLTEFPSELSTGPLGESIEVLDLSFNEIEELPPQFCLMKKLSVLSLKCNRLLKLPRNFRNLESLRLFSASHNELRLLPFGITKLDLDTLDLFHNPLNTDVNLHPEVSWEVPSLLEKSAAAIVEYKIPFTAKDIPSLLMNYIIGHSSCPCGKNVFKNTSSCILVLDLYKLASTVVYVNNTSRFKVPLEVFFCSRKCWGKFYSFTAPVNGNA